jgi:hypothetical protein
MYRAKNQAERYARNLPTYEGRPPFLIVIDVGYSFELCERCCVVLQILPVLQT